MRCAIIMSILFVICHTSTAQYIKIREGVWEGTASYYHDKFNGRLTSNGETFSNQKMTAASNFLKLGTRVRVTNLANGKTVTVRINDRMNKNNRRLIDMSKASAQQLGFIDAGLAKVRMEVIDGNTEIVARNAPNAYLRKNETGKSYSKTVKNRQEMSLPAKVNTARAKVVNLKSQNADLWVAKQYIEPKIEMPSSEQTKTDIVKEPVKTFEKQKKMSAKSVGQPVSYESIKFETKDSIHLNYADSLNSQSYSKEGAITKKVSTYWIEKQREAQFANSTKWLNLVAGYEKNFKEEAEYLSGALSPFMDSAQECSILVPNLKNGEAYRFILLSRQLGWLKRLTVEPIVNSEKENLKDLILDKKDLSLSLDKDNFIYFFNYSIPVNCDYLKISWKGIEYAEASHEDFWLFVFEQ